MYNRSNKKFTLVEILISMLLLVLIITGTINAMGQIQTSAVQNFDRLFAQQLLNEVSKKYEYINYSTLFAMARVWEAEDITVKLLDPNDEYTFPQADTATSYIGTGRMTFQVNQGDGSDFADSAQHKNYTPHNFNENFYNVDVKLELNDNASDSTNHAVRVVVSVEWSDRQDGHTLDVYRTFYRLEE